MNLSLRHLSFVLLLLLSACVPQTDELLPTSPPDLPAPTLTPMPAPIPASFPGPLGERVVFTYYFYWYDHQTGEHMDQQTHQPVPTPAVTWRGTEWHRRQVEDMLEAGIDVILPVYWGNRGTAWWAQPGLENLVAALEEVRLSGRTPPALAMMYDTNAHLYEPVDLLTEEGRRRVYTIIQAYHQRVPREYWALSPDGRPMIWFWATSALGPYDERLMDDLSDWFEADYGVRPFIVLDSSWLMNEVQVTHDATSTWIAAGSGSSALITTVSPGVDDRIVEHYTSHSVVDREDGNVYRNAWTKAMLCGTPWVAVESWNEYHEATEVAETIELGRQYIELTAEYAGYFKQGLLPAQGIISDYKTASQVETVLAEENQSLGLMIEISSQGSDGESLPGSWAGEAGRINVPEAPYMYFNVDDGFYFNTPQPIRVHIRYFDQGQGTIYLEYDSAPCATDWQPEAMHVQVPVVTLTDTRTWQTASVDLFDATLAGHQNGYNDFRLANFETPLILNQVWIEKLP